MSLLYRMLHLLVIGCVAGLATALSGVRGGFVLLVMLLVAGISIQQAVATCLVLQLVPVTLPAVYVYYHHGHVQLPLVMWVIMGSSVGILLGSWLVRRQFVTDRHIGQAMAIVLAGMTGYMVHRYFLS